MQSNLDRDTEAALADRLIGARRALRAADKGPHDVAAIRNAQAGMARLMGDALREIAARADSVTQENLEAIGFTGEEIARYEVDARGHARTSSVRQARRAA